MQIGHLRRREFIALLGSAATWPRVARGQFKPATIGVLGSGSAQSSAFLIDALKEGMKESGLAEGRDYVLAVRWAEGDYKRFAAFTVELLERKASVIIVTTIAAARAAQQVAPATPIIMTGLIDPVGAGLIASLARPGNNTTGISNIIQDMSAKGLELIREVIPTAKRIAVLFNPNNPGSRLILEDVRSQAAKLGMTMQPLEFMDLPRSMQHWRPRQAVTRCWSWPILHSLIFANASPGWHYDIGCQHFPQFPSSPTAACWSDTVPPDGIATDVPRLT